MTKKLNRTLIVVLMCIGLLFSLLFPAGAIDNSYYISQIGLTVKVPVEFTVITRDTEKDDKAFLDLSLDYDDTMKTFKESDIYLQGIDIENQLTLTITMTEDENSKVINSYNELTEEERKSILESMMTDKIYAKGDEKKHGDFYCLDFQIKKIDEETTTYGDQINTVVNGMNINLILTKEKTPLSSEQDRELNAIANTMTFDRITKTGPTFEWWRILLWLLIISVITFSIYFIYKQYNESNIRKERARKNNEEPTIEKLIPPPPKIKKNKTNISQYNEAEKRANEIEQLTFDEALGYENKEDFMDRSLSDLDSFEIKVSEEKANKGMEYFEDNGESVLGKEDYFDKYFKEQYVPRKRSTRIISAIGTYLKLFFKKIGYFFVNIGHDIASVFTKKHKK